MAGVDEGLARERRRTPLAVAGAVLGAILPLAGTIAGANVLADQPEDSASKLLFFHDHEGALLASGVLLSLGAIAILFPLRHLYEAAKLRRPEVPRAALFCALFACAVLAVTQIASQLVLADRAAEFAATGNQTYEEAKDIFESGPLRAVAAALLAAQLALGFAFVMISLNAMRVGLLTKFMGILGIIVGVLAVIPLTPGPPVVQSFWLGALTALFLGRWPGGAPPAWTTGKAMPWPTAQEMRERRERELAAHEPAPAPAGATPGPGRAAKRKRKKRR